MKALKHQFPWWFILFSYPVPYRANNKHAGAWSLICLVILLPHLHVFYYYFFLSACRHAAFHPNCDTNCKAITYKTKSKTSCFSFLTKTLLFSAIPGMMLWFGVRFENNLNLSCSSLAWFGTNVSSYASLYDPSGTSICSRHNHIHSMIGLTQHK